MTIESLPPDRHNHFNLLRLLAASAVIIAHCFDNGADPFSRLTGYDLGLTAVLAFFGISGFFIFQSFEGRTSNVAFLIARCVRILPALAAVSLISAFLIGPIFSELPTSIYFSQKSVWLYPVQTLSIARIMSTHLPQIFMHNPIPGAINGSLWTLYFEVACYIGLFLSGIVGLLARKRLPLLIAVYIAAYLLARNAAKPELEFLAVFSLPFVIGMLVYAYGRARLLRGWIALILVAAALISAGLGHAADALWSIAVAYGILWLGFARAPRLLAFNRLGDFSYGTYIYGFPVQQIVCALLPGIALAPMIGLTLAGAVLCGILSWYMVERPALRLRRLRIGRGAGLEIRPRVTPGVG